MPRQYCYRRRVQFAETDQAGFVHFSCFFRYMEEAEHAMWRDAGLSIAARESPVGWPRVEASFTYHAPLRFEDECDVVIRVDEVARKTIRYSCTIRRGETPIASGSMTVACVARNAASPAAGDVPMKAVEIPPDIAAAFQ